MVTPATRYIKFSDKLTGSLNEITRMIQVNKDMIDSVQEMALELTTVFGTLHTLTLKYARMANAILDVVVPIMAKIPLVSPNVIKIASDMEKLTQKIIDNSSGTEKVIQDVKVGLVNADVPKLKAHTGELQKVTKTLKAALPSDIK
jgi:hypothetical protein